MSFGEIVVVVCGLLLGYWLVSMFIAKKPAPPVDRAPSPEVQPSAVAAPGAWHDVLEIGAEASTEEIRAAYRQLLSQYHPDKVESLGPELRELAKRKTQEIIDAYRVGMRQRGVEP